MKLLAIDTSASACSVALLVDEEVKVLHEVAPMQQAQRILPLVNEALHLLNIELNQLDAIAFGCGPGSFTGVRIATSVAQGLGFAANVPLISISSLAGLAQAAYADLGFEKMLVAIDARIQEIYWGAYVVNSKGFVELQGQEFVCPPQELNISDENQWVGVGNAWEIYSSQIPCKPIQMDANRVAMASGILTLACEKYHKKEFVKAGNALPTYLRNDVAKKSSSS